jgi:hypothetical protein
MIYVFVGCFFVSESSKCYDKKSTCDDYSSSSLSEACTNTPQSISLLNINYFIHYIYTLILLLYTFFIFIMNFIIIY